MRQMKQPRKDALREQLALAADEIIRLRDDLEWANRAAGEANAILRMSWWRILLWKYR